MDNHVDETSHVIFLGKFENIKSYKEQILQEIRAAICAMLNSNGGKVVLHIDTDSNVPVEGSPFSQMSLVIRILEQSMISIIGVKQTVSNINFKEDEENIVVYVKKADSLITTNYNLYLPSQTQVVQVSPLEPSELIKDDIINKKFVPEPVQLGSHRKIFRKEENCGFHECKMVQFKNPKASSSKRTRLADRMTGKGNKFTCYVSAFANHCGGHIYYGITDDGIIEGELIPNEDISEITKKVEKAIIKMIWPEQICQPQRRVHWEIFFVPVLDANSQPIPSTFVVVIYIAPCFGGVFTEVPECYEMVEGKVKKMSFTTWEKRVLGPIKIELVPDAIGSSNTWISKRTQKLCVQAFCILTLCLNNGDLKGFEEKSNEIKKRFPDIIELELVVLLKQIISRSRRHNFNKANGILKKYNNLVLNAAERRIFEVLGVYVQAVYSRPKGNTLNYIRDLLVHAVAKSEWITPGLVTALVYLFAGTMSDRFNDTCLRPPDVLSHNALQHLQQGLCDFPQVRADLEHKAHITLATFHLGCNLSGELVTERVDDKSVDQANSSIMAIEQSVNRNNCNLTRYREVQLKLVKSIRCFRYSENHPCERMQFMQEAFEFSKHGENLAVKWKFYEMVLWSKTLQSLFTEKLLRAKCVP